MADAHPDHPERSIFYPLGSEWTHPSGAVYKVIRRDDGRFDWKLIRLPDGTEVS